MRRCADGDRAAWTEFVDRYGPLLAALARRMLRRRTGRAEEADVDEVVAEVFLALLRRDRALLHRYNPAFRLSTYLGVICRTEVSRHARRAGRFPRDLEVPDEVPERPGAPEPGDGLDEGERSKALSALREALAELSERDRLILSLRYLEGLDYRAIGAALGLNPESVGQLLHRAKDRLARRVPGLKAYVTESERDA